MSYASPSNVKSLFRNWPATSNPAVDDTELQQFLDEACALINAKIGTLYQLPITEVDNPESFKILRRVESFKVAGICDDIINTYTKEDSRPQWEKRACEVLKQLVPDKLADGTQPEPIIKLPDAIYLGTTVQKNQIKIGMQTGRVFVKGGGNW